MLAKVFDGRILTAVWLVTAAFVASGETYYLKGDDGQQKSSFASGATQGAGVGWQTEAGVSGGSYPTPGNDYVVPNGCDLRTPDKDGEYVFAGDSLTLMAGSQLVTKQRGGARKPLYIGRLIFKGGNCSISDTYSASSNPEKAIAGEIYVEPGYRALFGTTSGTDDRHLDVNSNIHGADPIVFMLSSGKSYIGLGGDNADFTGRVYVDNDEVEYTNNGGGRLYINSVASWFGNPSALDAGGLTIANGGQLWFTGTGELATGANRGFTINRKQATLDVAAGMAVTLEGPVTSAYGFKKNNAGLLALSGDNRALAEGSVITVAGGTLKLAAPTAAGSAAITLAAGTTLEVDPSAGAVQFAVLPAGLTQLKVSATHVDNPNRLELFSYPTTDGPLDVTTLPIEFGDLPAEVVPWMLELVSEEEDGVTTVALVLKDGELPWVRAELTALTVDAATFTVKAGFYDSALTDALTLTGCYGAADGGEDVANWANATALPDATAPGSYAFVVPLSASAPVHVAFRVESGEQVAWAETVTVEVPKVALSANRGAVLENVADGAVLTVTRPANCAAVPLVVPLAYSGDVQAFDAATLLATLTIPAGETTASQTVVPIDNATVDAVRALVVALDGDGVAFAPTAGADAVTVRLLDDESLTGAVCLVPDMDAPPAGAAERGVCVDAPELAFDYVAFVAEKTVYIYPGTYVATADLAVPANIAIRGETDASGVLPKLSLGSAYVMTIGAHTSVAGVELTGAKSKATLFTVGDGVLLENVTISGCTGFTSVMGFKGTDAVIRGCCFTNCVSTGNGMSILEVTGKEYRYVEDTRFVDCRCAASQYGAAIHTLQSRLNGSDVMPRLVLSRVQVTGCAGRQGAIRSDAGWLYATNCLFTANNGSDRTSWTVLACNLAKRLEIVNCTVTGNSGLGIDIAAASDATGIVLNSIVTGNSPKSGSEQEVVGDRLTARHSCYLEATGEDGNFAADPRLKPDYTLAAASPCVNAGEALNWAADAVDLAGNPRVRGGAVDLGCYERENGGLAILVR